jgi:hypothetical protein
MAETAKLLNRYVPMPSPNFAIARSFSIPKPFS